MKKFKMNLQLFASNFIGVDSLYYAVETSDTSAGTTHNTPKPLAGAGKVMIDPAISLAPFYFDNKVQEQAQIMAAGKISLDVNVISLSVMADIMGHTFDGSGGIVYNNSDQPPFVCIFYRREKAKMFQSRYVKILKCKFHESKDDAETIGASVKGQNDTIDGEFFGRIFDGNWRKVKDTEEPGYVDVSTTWFTAVDSSDVTIPTISSSTPANNATAVVISIAPQIVFSKAMAPGTITNSSISLVDSTTGAPVAATVTYNATNNAATLTPSANLTAARKYYLELDGTIADLSGNKLTATNLTFTCA